MKPKRIFLLASEAPSGEGGHYCSVCIKPESACSCGDGLLFETPTPLSNSMQPVPSLGDFGEVMGLK